MVPTLRVQWGTCGVVLWVACWANALALENAANTPAAATTLKARRIVPLPVRAAGRSRQARSSLGGGIPQRSCAGHVWERRFLYDRAPARLALRFGADRNAAAAGDEIGDMGRKRRRAHRD